MEEKGTAIVLEERLVWVLVVAEDEEIVVLEEDVDADADVDVDDMLVLDPFDECDGFEGGHPFRLDGKVDE